MSVIEVKTPSDYELDLLLEEEADESSEWLIRERIPYVEEPEFNDHVTNNNMRLSVLFRESLTHKWHPE